MKKKEKSHYQGMPVEELRKVSHDTQEELVALSMKRFTEPQKNSRGLLVHRKKLAVIKTIIRQKELSGGVS